MSETEKKTEEKTEAKNDLEDLRDLIDYLVYNYTYTMVAVSDLPRELVVFAGNLFAELDTRDRRELISELSKVQALNEILLEAVKSNRDHGFFMDHSKEYFRIMSKLSTIRKLLVRVERLDENVKPVQILELAKSVEQELKALIFEVMDYINDCPDFNDFEECCDDEPEEPDDDDNTVEEEEEPEESEDSEEP